MITHVVTMTLAPDAPAGRAEEIAAALRQLPAAIPELKEYHVGADLGLVEGNYDLAAVARFDDVAGYQAYASAPVHVAIIHDLIRPVLTGRCAVQFED
jgi:hypothetical protein